MNTLIKSFGVLMLSVFVASAQFVSGPLVGSVITISSNYFLPGITKTNIPTGSANLIPVGKNGIGFYAKLGATNAATTTNIVVVLEQFVTGTVSTASDWVSAGTFSLALAPNGTSAATVYTNLLPTSANLSNARWLRVKSIDNTNALGAFLTNFSYSIRE